MVGGIGNQGGSGFRPVNGPGSGKPVDKAADVNASEQAATNSASSPTPQTEKALRGQMDAIATLGKSQISSGPSGSIQALMKEIPPGGAKDKLLNSVADKVASKTVPGYQTMDEMDKAMALSDIRVSIMENPELSGLLGIKLNAS